MLVTLARSPDPGRRSLGRRAAIRRQCTALPQHCCMCRHATALPRHCCMRCQCAACHGTAPSIAASPLRHCSTPSFATASLCCAANTRCVLSPAQELCDGGTLRQMIDTKGLSTSQSEHLPNMVCGLPPVAIVRPYGHTMATLHFPHPSVSLKASVIATPASPAYGAFAVLHNRWGPRPP